MKHFTLIVFGLTALTMLMSSCKKDEAEPQFEVADLIGVWEQIGGDDFVSCSVGNNALIEITDAEVQLGAVDDIGCSAGGGLSAEYEFKNGNTFDTELFVFKVTSLNGDRMTAVLSSFGSNLNYELRKIQ